MSRIKVARTEHDKDATPEIDYGGLVFQLPNALDLDALDAMERDKPVEFIQLVLGPDQYAELKPVFDHRDLKPFVDGMFEAIQGEDAEKA